MIRLQCPTCGRGIQVQEAHAGKRGMCPGCKAVVHVPSPAKPATHDKVVAADQAHQDIVLPDGELRLKERPSASLAFEPKPPAWDQPKPPPPPDPPKGVRRYPWLVDVLLYPTSPSGMLNLLIFAVLIPVFERAIGPLAVRMPYLFVGNLFILFAVPAGIYYWLTRRTDLEFWVFMGLGGFCAPMALLSVILFDSLSGLDPRIWLTSIPSVLGPYVALLIVLVGMYILSAFGTVLLARSVAGMILALAVSVYLAMIAAHILGRFYFRYEERLSWDV